MAIRCALPIAILLGGAATEACMSPPPSLLCQRRKNMSAHMNRKDIIESWQEMPNPLNGSDTIHYDLYTRPAVATAVYNWSSHHSDSTTRPELSNPVEAENVKLELFVNSVWDIDQRSGSFQVQAHLTMDWQDDRLCFNSGLLQDVAVTDNLGHQNGDECFRIQIDEAAEQQRQGLGVAQTLWTPDIHFVNSIKAGDSEEADASLISVTDNGHVTWRRRFILTLSSDFDFTNLPYDRQVLSIYLESYRLPASAMRIEWSKRHKTDGLNIHFGAVGSEMANPNHNPEWCFRKEGLKGDEDDCKHSKQDENSRVWSHTGIYNCQDDHADGFERPADCIDGSKDGAYKQRAFLRLQVQRQTEMWKSAYITPTMLLLLLSYCGLFIGNHNPGRPSVHCLTILAHLTIDASIRAQIPSISNETWITKFNEGVLYFMVLIFIEYCIVHYAYRQKKKLKRAKHREQEVFLDAVKLRIQMKAMSEDQRCALEALLEAIPNSWLAGAGEVTDKRAKKVQQKLGLQDDQLEVLLNNCAQLLRSPQMTASELMGMCYGMGTGAGGGSKDEPGEPDMSASMRYVP